MSSIAGLPDHNVLLLGDVSSHSIVNNSTRKILGYTLAYHYLNGPSINRITLSFLAIRNGQTAGIAPGSRKSISSDQSGVSGPTGSSGTPASVTLDAVIFEDGEIVGPDATHTFELVSAKLNAERDLHKQFLTEENGDSAAQANAWSKVIRASKGQIDVPLTETQKTIYAKAMTNKAKELLSVRDKQNDSAAFRLAHQSAKYPDIWRKGQ